MRKLSVILAAVAVMVSTFGGVAAASGGGTYPPKPVTIIVQTPTVPVGVGFWAKGQGLCVGTPARFVLASISDPSLPEYWTPEVTVDANGTAIYTFTPAELAPFGTGQIRVTVKQFSPTCFSSASTIVTITGKPVKSPSIDVTPTSPKIGQDIRVRVRDFCPDTKIRFILQAIPGGQLIAVDTTTDKNGAATHTFLAADLPGGPGTYDVWAKQTVGCDLIKSVTITVSDSKAATPKASTPKAPTPKSDDPAKTEEPAKNEPAKDEPAKDEPVTDEPVTDEPETDEPETDEPETDSAQSEAASAGPVAAAVPPAAATGPAASDKAPAAAADAAKATVTPVTPITPVVLSAGLTAPTTASAATPAAVAPSSAQVASAAAAAAAPGDTLPVTGAEPSRTLQIALTALLAGIGMIIVTSVRRRTANVRSR